MSEVRRTADSPQGESGAKSDRSRKHCRNRGAWGGWRRNVWKCVMVNQGYLFWCWKEQDRSQSPHSSCEAANPRGAKEDRKVKAGYKDDCNTNCRECLWLSKAESKQQESGLNACRERSQEKIKEAAGLCLLLAPWADLLSLGSKECVPICIHRHRLESRMREIRPSGLEGGVA